MSDPIKKIEETFKINNLRTAIMGGTIISLDPASGTDSTNTPTASISAKSYLNMFFELSELEKEQGNPFDHIGLSTIWNVGFTSQHERINTPDFFGGNSTKYLKNRKIKTLDQLFGRRSESSTSTFFGCFQMKGSKQTIINKCNSGSDEEEFKRYALICNNWTNKPQTIQYVASIKANDKSRDYLYLIGCDEPEFFIPDDLMENIIQMQRENIALQKQNNPARSVSADIRDTCNNIGKIWTEVSHKTLPENIVKHPQVAMAFNNRLLARTVHGVINFYNYLLHAHKQLKILSLYEVNGDKLEKTVKIVQLLKEYETVYKYCMNVTTHGYLVL
jgi:hypothetical protein